MTTTFIQIREWAEARNLINGSDSFRQLAKLKDGVFVKEEDV